MHFTEFDKICMRRALAEACKSAASGEVPVGAVITDGVDILAVSGNSPIGSLDPTAHAEIMVIRKTARLLRNYRLIGTTLYVTLEPCLMCMGAIIHSRIDRLVFGARDPKAGAAVSRYRVGTDGLLNHSIRIEGGLLEEQCGMRLKDFFTQKRT